MRGDLISVDSFVLQHTFMHVISYMALRHRKHTLQIYHLHHTPPRRLDEIALQSLHVLMKAVSSERSMLQNYLDTWRVSDPVQVTRQSHKPSHCHTRLSDRG